MWTGCAAWGGALPGGRARAGRPAAGSHKKRHTAPAAQDMVGSDVQLAPRNGWSTVPPAAWPGPYGCVTDEGYGRYAACDAGGGGAS